MSLLRKPPTCPIHNRPLTLSHHGKKSNLGHYYIEVVGAPLLYCPECHERGRDTSVEIEPAASNAFLKKLAQLLDGSDFPGLLSRPRIRVDFNPGKTRLEPPLEEHAGTLYGDIRPASGADLEPGPGLGRLQGPGQEPIPGSGQSSSRGPLPGSGQNPSQNPSQGPGLGPIPRSGQSPGQGPIQGSDQSPGLGLTQGSGPRPSQSPARGPAPSPVPPAAARAEDEPPRLEGIDPVEPRHSLDHLILDEETLDRIREATNVLIAQDLLYDTWNLRSVARTGRRVALNFYGPPGTGKTLAADAMAELLGKKILRVSYAELESKYVGETPKNIQAAFAKATETGALLFFDEADSILGRRLTNVSQSADSGINVARGTTLIELDNFNGAVIFASNLVTNYDTAFLRRMLAHVEFRLPGPRERERLWQGHLPRELPVRDNLDFALLARASEGAAGGDIQNAVLLAASYASMRAGAERAVKQADLERAIRFILEAKHRILEGAPGLSEEAFF